MHMTRRGFAGGALGLALVARPALAKPVAARPGMAEAIQAIGNYADAHRRFYNLPNMTLSVTAPDGFSTIINRGVADLEDRRPVGPETLFQIGSITKSITAAIIHQLAAEGRLSLDGGCSPAVAGSAVARCANHGPAIARPCLGPARRRSDARVGRAAVGRLRTRQALVVFERRLRASRPNCRARRQARRCDS